MFFVAGVLCVPNGQYALEMTRKGHGATAINNTFSSQIPQYLCRFWVLPLMIDGFRSGEGVTIPDHQVVAQTAIMLAVGSLAFIGMTLIPALIRKPRIVNCQLSVVRFLLD